MHTVAVLILSTQALEDQGLLPRLHGHHVLRWAGLIRRRVPPWAKPTRCQSSAPQAFVPSTRLRSVSPKAMHTPLLLFDELLRPVTT